MQKVWQLHCPRGAERRLDGCWVSPTPRLPSTSVHLCPWQSAGSLVLSHGSSSLPVSMYFRLHTDKSVPFAKLMDKIRVVPGKWGHEQGRGDKSKHLPKINGETLTLGVNIIQGGQGHGLLGFCAVGRRQVVWWGPLSPSSSDAPPSWP